MLAVSGPDREAFLQGQLTQDVRGLGPGEARRMAGLTPKGKLLYFGWLVAERERLLLLVPFARREAVLGHLSRYAVFQKVAVTDVTGDFALVALYGPEAAALALPARVVCLPAEGEISAGALAPSAGGDPLARELEEAGSVALSEASAEALRLEAGRPRFGRDADESHLPDEVALGEAIAAGKGCYVGQEVVARLRTYGRPARRLAGFRFAGPALPPPGTAYPDPEKPGRELGRVTSTALSPRFGPIGIGLLARDVEDGRALGAGDAAAVVVALPFA